MSSFEDFDSRGYPTLAAREGYERWAATYEDTVEDAMDVALLERLALDWGAVERAADLGCGTGRTGEWLVGRGVGEVDGVDISPAMLAAAHARGVYASLQEGEVARTGLEEAAYDLATCCLVDEHLADLRPLYAEAARLLRPAGIFVLVGIHPHFVLASGMPTHFDDAESGGSIAIETHLHLLREHVAAARAAGLALATLEERTIDDEWVALKPKWERFRGHPISFAAVWSTMPHLIAWCGFLGAWLLVAGPLDQAVREIEDQGFEHEILDEAAGRVEKPPPVSPRWLFLPPVWWYLRRRRDGVYRHRVGEAMADEDLLAFLTVRDVLNAWLYVAIGAALIAVKETWELHESYEWPEWTFWLGVLGMVALCISMTVGRTRRRHTRPAAEASAGTPR